MDLIVETTPSTFKAYRVENQRVKHGIWRTFDGEVSPIFTSLSNGKCKDMPMDDSDFYRDGGYKWFSATDTKEKLRNWFSKQDILEMEKLGYKIFEFVIKQFRPVSEFEIVFRREDIITQAELPIESIYP